VKLEALSVGLRTCLVRRQQHFSGIGLYGWINLWVGGSWRLSEARARKAKDLGITNLKLVAIKAMSVN